MRSLLLALALAAPVSAVAATPTSTNPVNAPHHVSTPVVLVTFINHTSQEREVRIGNEQIKMRNNTQMSALVPVGSVVRLYSNENSKVDGLEMMQVSADDAHSAVFLK